MSLKEFEKLATEQKENDIPEIQKLKNQIFFDRMSSGNGQTLSDEEYTKIVERIKELEK